MYSARCSKADTLFSPDPDFLLGDVIDLIFFVFFYFSAAIGKTNSFSDWHSRIARPWKLSNDPRHVGLSL